MFSLKTAESRWLSEILKLKDFSKEGFLPCFITMPISEPKNLSGNPISELSDEKEEVSILDGIGTLSGEELQQLLDLVSEKKK